MDKIRTWFNKAKKEVGTQVMVQPSTPERKQANNDVTVITEMLSLTERDLDSSDLIQNTRLNMLRSLLHEEQVEQVQQVTGDGSQTAPTSHDTRDVICLTPVVGGATDTGSCDITSASYCSLPSSPHLVGRRQLPCSLPCSPLLGGRRWRSSPASPSPPPALSRLLVEAALQRSKIRPTPPCSPQVSSWGRTEEEDDDKQVNIVGIRLLETVTGRKEEEEQVKQVEQEEQEESDLLYLERWRCSLTPCVCLRCPSAPPYEAENSSGDQKLSEGSTQLSQRTEVHSLPEDGAPQLGEGSRLYPSLSLWRVTADSQTEPNGEVMSPVSTCPGECQTPSSADLSIILKKVFDSTMCSKKTTCPVESCSFCSDKLSVQIMKHLCRNCDQVFCSGCLSHFISLLQIHQFSQTAAV